MAEFNQDLIIFEDDTLLLRYTFLDVDFPAGSDFWWGAVSSSAWPNSQGEPANCSAHTAWGDPNWISTGNVTTTSPNIVNIQFNQDMFAATDTYVSGNLQTDTEYYTELIYTPNGNDEYSVVAATGLLYISSSMFSIAGYRP